MIIACPGLQREQKGRVCYREEDVTDEVTKHNDIPWPKVSGISLQDVSLGEVLMQNRRLQ